MKRWMTLFLSILLSTSAAAELKPLSESNPKWFKSAQRVYERMPEIAKKEDVTVSQGKMLQKGWLAYYWDNAIIMKDWSNHVFIHEVGHHIHVTGITAEQWQEWLELYRSNRSKLPTKYARTNPAEGFADCFEAYKLQHTLAKPFKKYFAALTLKEGIKPQPTEWKACIKYGGKHE